MKALADALSPAGRPRTRQGSFASGQSILSVGFRKRLFRRLRYWADWRCLEPVVVFESDDWGMERRACSEFLRAFGEPGEWADEELETPDDLARLYEVLERHRDTEGRAASFTTNFVVANPDFEAIARDQFTCYHETPIGQTDGLKSHWLEGLERKVFFPQYHARSHFWPEAWLRDLRRAIPGAREMCERGYHGGLSLLEGRGWRYHSEYMDWSTGEERSFDELLRWLKGGLEFFQDAFGFFPRSTIASHYILTPAIARAWRTVGGEFVQGTDYRILRDMNGQPQPMSHTLGERAPDGLLLTGRNVKFDPRPQRPQRGVDAALRQIKDCFANHLPAIIDTHRINFTGRWREQSVQALDDLLSALKPYRPRFLTSVELGEAIAQSGSYRDVWSKKACRLTPLDQSWRKMLRGRFGVYNVQFISDKTSDSPLPN